MDLGIRGRTALVLGGGGGLGSTVALALAREGVNVAVADIDEAAAAKVRDAVTATGVESCSVAWNLAELGMIEPNAAKIEATLGPVDILINNTGGPPPTPAAGQRPELWSQQFQAMVLSVISITDRVLPQMRARKWAHRHQRLLGRAGADTQPRHFERLTPFPGRLVEDARSGNCARRDHLQHRRTGPYRNRTRALAR